MIVAYIIIFTLTFTKLVLATTYEFTINSRYHNISLNGFERCVTEYIGNEFYFHFVNSSVPDDVLNKHISMLSEFSNEQNVTMIALASWLGFLNATKLCSEQRTLTQAMSELEQDKDNLGFVQLLLNDAYDNDDKICTEYFSKFISSVTTAGNTESTTIIAKRVTMTSCCSSQNFAIANDCNNIVTRVNINSVYSGFIFNQGTCWYQSASSNPMIHGVFVNNGINHILHDCNACGVGPAGYCGVSGWIKKQRGSLPRMCMSSLNQCRDNASC